MAIGDISFVKYVPKGFVHVYERHGWEVIPGYFVGEHHAMYCEGMKPGPDCTWNDGDPLPHEVAA